MPIPEPIVQLQRQLDQFRSAQPHRTKIPESAVAGSSGVGASAWSVCSGSSAAVGLCGAEASSRRSFEVEEKKKVASPGFVELIAAHPATCGVRDRVRVQERGQDAHSVEGIDCARLVSLFRAWRESER